MRAHAAGVTGHTLSLSEIGRKEGYIGKGAREAVGYRDDQASKSDEL